MNRGEFNLWIKRQQALFSNLSAWFEQQPDAKVIHDAWAKALETCTAQHAAEATDRMLRGVSPLVEFNDWSSLPAVVIQHCRLLGSGKVERSGDGNYVSGSALKAMRDSFREEAPSNDAAAFREFEALVDVMDPADLLDTRNRILDAMDAGKLKALSARDLLSRALEKAGAVRFGKPDTPRCASSVNAATAGHR